MRIPARYYLTRILVLFSLLGSLGSVLTLHFGLGEIYPFYTWKLYSQPLGSTGYYTEYRIYSTINSKQKFKRKPIKATPTFTREEYVYTFNALVAKTLANSVGSTDYKAKLLLFIKHVDPGAAAYKVVSETYNPKDLAAGLSHYDTATVVTF